MKKLDLETLKLDKGSHVGPDYGFCVMEAVAYIAGEEWSDRPQCTSLVISDFLRTYNDAVDDNVRQSLKEYIPRLVGNRGSQETEIERSFILTEWYLHVQAPLWLRLGGFTNEADTLSSISNEILQSDKDGVLLTLERVELVTYDAVENRCMPGVGDDFTLYNPLSNKSYQSASQHVICSYLSTLEENEMCLSKNSDICSSSVSISKDAVAIWWLSNNANQEEFKAAKEALYATVPDLIERMLNVSK